MRSLILGAVGALMLAGTAVAGPVTLKANPVDSDGRVTLGDLFDDRTDDHLQLGRPRRGHLAQSGGGDRWRWRRARS